MNKFFECIRNMFKKERKLTIEEKRGHLEKLHQDFSNSDEYMASSNTFHYKNGNYRRLNIEIPTK